MTDLEPRLMEMDLGPLFGLWFQSLFIGITMWALYICIFIVIYGRMIEIYLVTSVAPVPMAAMMGKEWGGMGQNYLRSLLALGFQAFLIIVCDPEAEYFPLVQKLGGQVIRISPVSTDYINPLDINTNYSEEENPLTLKSDFILSMCELIVGGKDGLQPVEKTIIDRSVRMVYQEFLADPKPEKMPILEDLYNILRNQKEPEAQRIATALEIYVHGSLNVFNHRTNAVSYTHLR